MQTTSEQENNIIALKNAIDEGVKSGVAVGFDPQEHLINLKNRISS